MYQSTPFYLVACISLIFILIIPSLGCKHDDNGGRPEGVGPNNIVVPYHKLNPKNPTQPSFSLPQNDTLN